MLISKHYLKGKTFYEKDYYDNFFDDYQKLTEEAIHNGNHYDFFDYALAAWNYDRSFPHIIPNLDAAAEKCTPLTFLIVLDQFCSEDDPDYKIETFISKMKPHPHSEEIIKLINKFSKDVDNEYLIRESYWNENAEDPDEAYMEYFDNRQQWIDTELLARGFDRKKERTIWKNVQN